MTEKNDQTKDWKRWIQRSISLNSCDLDSVISRIYNIIRRHRSKIIKEKRHENGLSIDAIYGSRFIAFIMHFIPLIGRHLPSGKRLYLKISVFKEKRVGGQGLISEYWMTAEYHF